MTGISPKSLRVVGSVASVGTLLLVLVLTGVIPLLPAGAPPPACNSNYCGGPAFAIGNPVAGSCPSDSTFAAVGCHVGDFTFNISIGESVISFGNVLFHLETPNGSVFVATGGEPGFSVLSFEGKIAAQYSAGDGVMSMSSSWTYFSGTNASTALSVLYSILIDMGSIAPTTPGYSFVATGTGTFSGGAVLPLP